MGKPTISIGFGPLKRVLVQLGMLVYQRGICIEHEGLLSRKVSRRSRMSWTSWTSLCDRHAMNINQDHPEKLPLWESSQHRSQNLLLNFKEKLNRLWLCHICIFLLYIYTYSIWITHIVYICICIYIYIISMKLQQVGTVGSCFLSQKTRDPPGPWIQRPDEGWDPSDATSHLQSGGAERLSVVKYREMKPVSL